MSSIFSLASSAAELPSFNANMSQMKYRQVPPQKAINGASFPGSLIDFDFAVSGTQWWLPARSYIRMRCSLQNGAGDPILLGDDVAPNMSLCANLFSSAELQIAGTTVSRISQLMPQVDAMSARLNKSGAWLRSGAGKLNWWQPHQQERANHVAADGQIEVDDAKFAPSTSPRVSLGWNAATTTAWTLVDRTLTFAAGGVNIRRGPGKLYVGDILTMSGVGFTAGDRIRVEEILTDTTATGHFLNKAEPADVAGLDLFEITRIQQEGEARGTFELIWQPPLSVFRLQNALPSGSYRLVLNPLAETDFQRAAIESFVANKAPGAGNDFQFGVIDMHLYINQMEGPRVDDKVYLLSLDELRCQTTPIPEGGGFTQRFFDVSPSTYALTVAVQDTQVVSNSLRSASKFKIRPTVTGVAGTDTSGGADLYLTRLFISYAGEQRPQPDAQPDYRTPVNFLSQQFATSNFYSGQYYSEGGPETEAEWRTRGPYYHFSWPKDGTSEDTRVIVNYEFSPAIVAGEGRLLLWDSSHKVVMVTIKDGRVTDVKLQDG